MGSLFRILDASIAGRLVLPGYPDTARLQVQLPNLRLTLGTHTFRGRVLNAGCGEGLYSDFLESFREIARIDNVDIDFPAAVQRRADTRNHVAQGSLTDLPYEPGVFDGCLCTEVIEHIADHDKAVSELWRVLKPGGLLLASVPQNPAPYDPNHARQGYDAAEFRALLERNGFQVVTMTSCFHWAMRFIMHYWRSPAFRFGSAGTPYLPKAVLWCLGELDNLIPAGVPWDLCVVAIRRP